MAKLILIPPKSNTFSHWSRTCHVSWVNKHLMTGPAGDSEFCFLYILIVEIEVEGIKKLTVSREVRPMTRDTFSSSQLKIPGFHVTKPYSKIKNCSLSEVLVSSDYRLYRNLAFYNVLARQGSSFCTWLKEMRNRFGFC